jgi:hypothetical protein
MYSEVYVLRSMYSRVCVLQRMRYVLQHLMETTYSGVCALESMQSLSITLEYVFQSL